MGNGSRTVEGVPEQQLDFVVATLKEDFNVVTTEKQVNGLWNVTGRDPKVGGSKPAKPPVVPVVPPNGVATETSGAASDVETLARTLWGEGRGGSDEGLSAIASVVMNRLDERNRGRFGRTVSEVCLQPKQFSCWNENDPNRAKILNLKNDDPGLARCRVVAQRAIEGKLTDLTSGADHYHHDSITPVWARGKAFSAKFDHHLFYNNIDT